VRTVVVDGEGMRHAPMLAPSTAAGTATVLGLQPQEAAPPLTTSSTTYGLSSSSQTRAPVRVRVTVSDGRIVRIEAS
jgi:hypothetical protein